MRQGGLALRAAGHQVGVVQPGPQREGPERQSQKSCRAGDPGLSPQTLTLHSPACPAVVLCAGRDPLPPGRLPASALNQQAPGGADCPLCLGRSSGKRG